MKKETKIEKTLDAAQVAEFLNCLGMAIVGNGDPSCIDHGFSVDNFDKVKVTLEREGAIYSLKVKIKATGRGVANRTMPPVAENTGAGDAVKGTYKELKMRMKGCFVEIKRLLGQGEAPSSELLRRFLEDSQLMTSFPGMGDEYYEPYQQCCRQFAQACASGDIEAMRTALVAIEAQKKSCHAQYK